MQYINYRENRRIGTADFPLEYYHVTASHPQYVMSFHWHVEFELIRILSGSLTVTIVKLNFLQKQETVFSSQRFDSIPVFPMIAYTNVWCSI